MQFFGTILFWDKLFRGKIFMGSKDDGGEEILIGRIKGTLSGRVLKKLRWPLASTLVQPLYQYSRDCGWPRWP